MITICYSGNEKIFKGILLSAMSLIKYCDEPIEIKILSMNLTDKNPSFRMITEEQIDILDKTLKGKNSLNKAELVDATALYKAYLADGKNSDNGYTPYALLRLLLDIMPEFEKIDKLLYIDADTMATSDIKELYVTDIEDYELAAVKDFLGRFFINPHYFNTGVLLLNLKMIRETKLFQRARAKVNKTKMIMPDQSALNKFAKHKLYLPRRFNEQRKIKNDTVIKHFCKALRFYPFFFIIYNYKQWDIEKVHNKLKIHDFDDIYEEFEKIYPNVL